MKLEELKDNTETLWEGELDGEQVKFFVELHEGMSHAGFAQNSRGGVVRGAMKFMSNPIVAGLAAGYAVDALGRYERNKRYTTRFFARDAQEKKLYKQIVDDLMRTGHYKKVKEKHVDGGIMWELRRKM